MADEDQRFSINPDPPTAGQNVDITYTNADLAGDTVTITISNGEGHSEPRQINIGSNGVGTTTFPIPEGWDVLRLNGPDTPQFSSIVYSGSPTL